jgi:RND family efflux transporter MFP subunit
LQPWAQQATPVAIEIAELAPVTRVLAVNGRMAARHSVEVRSLVGGPLTDVLVEEGDVVPSGAVLARIDPATQQAVVRQAVAGLDAALVAQDQARVALARAEGLAGTVPQTAIDDATTAVQRAAQEVARTTALVDQARIQLERHTIRAPMAGTVLTLNADAGQNVEPATVLLTLADMSHLVVETDVDETYATQIRPGMPVVLQLAGEKRLRDGRVDFASQHVDAATGGLAVRLVFNEEVTAPVGLSVTANIIVDSRDAALTVPRTALASGGEGTAVFVVKDGRAMLRPVSVIDWPAARLIVTQGLTPGEAVVVDGVGLGDGQAVRAEAR